MIIAYPMCQDRELQAMESAWVTTSRTCPVRRRLGAQKQKPSGIMTCDKDMTRSMVVWRRSTILECASRR